MAKSHGDYVLMEELGALVMWMANGEGLLGEGENLHVDGGGSVPSTRLPPSPSSRAILKM